MSKILNNFVLAFSLILLIFKESAKILYEVFKLKLSNNLIFLKVSTESFLFLTFISRIFPIPKLIFPLFLLPGVPYTPSFMIE